MPSGADDDWYWMTASLVTPQSPIILHASPHTNTSKHTHTTPVASAPYVVTNDRMRDHKLSFIAPRPFIR
ncbi:hypothetical protein EON65_35760 [archaeon]|nr:MAG: hypothetical protein EON65_35760 [archaeon]